jgi:hypothetical protein
MSSGTPALVNSCTSRPAIGSAKEASVGSSLEYRETIKEKRTNCRLLRCADQPKKGWSRRSVMNFGWEEISNFGSLRERDCFLVWIQSQIASGVAEEVDVPTSIEAGERWFLHIPTQSVWRLISDENPYGPGFWPAYGKAA